ncbi:MAG: hypothetical protein EHM78_02320 [Myxococcaceae bacterium]|nr:MAG: hypothetical protein EHM78_02320 [Myxococcaceae bacterium]
MTSKKTSTDGPEPKQGRVYVRFVKGKRVGELVRSGPEQSEVRWMHSGSLQTIPNYHLEVLDGPQQGDVQEPTDSVNSATAQESTMAKTAAKKKAPKTAAKKAAKKTPATARKVTPKSATDAARTPAANGTSATRTRTRDEQVIRLKADENPRREGTDAHAHYEKMRGGISIGKYLAKFPTAERRNARQWLTNTVRDGHISLVG